MAARPHKQLENRPPTERPLAKSALAISPVDSLPKTIPQPFGLPLHLAAIQSSIPNPCFTRCAASIPSPSAVWLRC